MGEEKGREERGRGGGEGKGKRREKKGGLDDGFEKE